MYIRLTKSKKSKHPTLQIVQGIRQGSKVKQKIVASLGVIKSKEDLVKISKLAENLVRRLEKEGISFGNKVITSPQSGELENLEQPGRLPGVDNTCYSSI